MATEERKDNKKPFKGVSNIDICYNRDLSEIYYRLRSSGLQTCLMTCLRTQFPLQRRLLTSMILKPMVLR